MDRFIDLRSDTVTWPTPAMYHAMTTAPVGDDVFEDDPTVKKLEAMAAGAMRVLTGEEEALTYSGRPVWEGFADEMNASEK